ncbi:DUF5688 family protein [[Clostridium] aminophilum]|uniref:Uncharacterized protein n=1 Tax=[Clostridium] aminophilum TaxID=1526 RepID=A0A1I6IBH3_9FIRM|nr:DUF5688 family protein [[Clostridium] aminophilum]SFR63979.1 hypothetical protein SAMN02910262_00157 [[Clostridium] aminophilum]
MKYEFFLDTLLSLVSDRMKDRCEVRPIQVLKNNGCRLDGLSFLTPGCSISPTVYLTPLYSLCEDGMTVDELADRIVRTAEETPAPLPVSIPDLTSENTIRTNTCLRLVSRDRNTEFLADVPHIDFLDFSIIPYLCLGEHEDRRMTAVLHRSHLQNFDITEEELMQLALENTVRLFPPTLHSMDEELHLENVDDPLPLYVLTNPWAASGAAAILYPNLLKNFADSLGEDLLILPSSIHEILLLPSSMVLSLNDVDKMIREINATQVSPEERLSDHHYLFHRKDNTISAPTCPEIPAQSLNFAQMMPCAVA